MKAFDKFTPCKISHRQLDKGMVKRNCISLWFCITWPYNKSEMVKYFVYPVISKEVSYCSFHIKNKTKHYTFFSCRDENKSESKDVFCHTYCNCLVLEAEHLWGVISLVINRIPILQWAKIKSSITPLRWYWNLVYAYLKKKKKHVGVDALHF